MHFHDLKKQHAVPAEATPAIGAEQGQLLTKD
jgi:hypothetical protein